MGTGVMGEHNSKWILERLVDCFAVVNGHKIGQLTYGVPDL